jgi:N-acetylmuramoyl-L-alanine amidase
LGKSRTKSNRRRQVEPETVSKAGFRWGIGLIMCAALAASGFAAYFKFFAAAAPSGSRLPTEGEGQVINTGERPQRPPAGKGRGNERLIALDIGHTLTQPGAVSARGRPEFQFNRDLVKVLDSSLRNRAFRTLVINPEGKPIKLFERAARAKGASLFLSIHHDSVKPQYLSQWDDQGVSRSYSDRFNGFALFVSPINSHFQESRRCASAIGTALRTAGFEPSKYHADPITGESRPFLDEANGVHQYDNLVVLKKSEAPAVLLEAGVIVNRDEEERLMDSGIRKTMVDAITEGLQSCLLN